MKNKRKKEHLEDIAFKEFKTNWSPLRYQQDLERTGVPKILAEMEMRQYLQLYNHILRYRKISMDMRNYK